MIRMLVIDDEKDFTDLIVGRFGKMCAVDVAATGQAGLDRLAAHRPDVLVVDNNLPDIPGVEIVRRVRGARTHIPVVMITCDRQEAVAAALAPYRVEHFFRKPFDFGKVNAAIMSLLSAAIRKKGRRPVAPQERDQP